MTNLKKFLSAFLIAMPVALNSVSAQTLLPVVVHFPLTVKPLFTASSGPQIGIRIGDFYVGGATGITRLGAPSTLITPNIDVVQLETYVDVGGSRNRLFALGRKPREIYVQELGIAGAKNLDSNAVFSAMQLNQKDAYLLTLDEAPSQEGPATSLIER